jgi:hypothetical protein
MIIGIWFPFSIWDFTTGRVTMLLGVVSLNGRLPRRIISTYDAFLVMSSSGTASSNSNALIKVNKRAFILNKKSAHHSFV